jgi:hypothetical protein
MAAAWTVTADADRNWGGWQVIGKARGLGVIAVAPQADGTLRVPKDRVAPHRFIAVERLHTDRVDMHIVSVGDQGHRAGQLTLCDTRLHRLVQTVEAGLRSRAHHLRTLRLLTVDLRPGKPSVRPSFRSRFCIKD